MHTFLYFLRQYRKLGEKSVITLTVILPDCLARMRFKPFLCHLSEYGEFFLNIPELLIYVGVFYRRIGCLYAVPVLQDSLHILVGLLLMPLHDGRLRDGRR